MCTQCSKICIRAGLNVTRVNCKSDCGTFIVCSCVGCASCSLLSWVHTHCSSVFSKISWHTDRQCRQGSADARDIAVTGHLDLWSWFRVLCLWRLPSLHRHVIVGLFITFSSVNQPACCVGLIVHFSASISVFSLYSSCSPLLVFLAVD